MRRRGEGASERDNEEGVSRGNLMVGRKRNAGRGHRSVTAGRECHAKETSRLGMYKGERATPPTRNNSLLMSRSETTASGARGLDLHDLRSIT